LAGGLRERHGTVERQAGVGWPDQAQALLQQRFRAEHGRRAWVVENGDIDLSVEQEI